MFVAEIFENQWKWPSGWRDVCYTMSVAPSALPSITSPKGSSPTLSSQPHGAAAHVSLVNIHKPMPAWSDLAGVRSLHPETFAPLPLENGISREKAADAGVMRSIRKSQTAPTMEWMGEWSIDDIDADEEKQGWMYGENFPSLIAACEHKYGKHPSGRGGFHSTLGSASTGDAGLPARKPRPSWEHPVRRRRWTRPYRIIGAAPDAPATPEARIATPEPRIAVTRDSPSASVSYDGAQVGDGKPSRAVETLLKLKLKLPHRNAKSPFTFEDIAADITELLRVSAGLRKLVALVGGDRDSITLRRSIEKVFAEMLERMPALEACIQAGNKREKSEEKESGSELDAIKWTKLQSEHAKLARGLHLELASYRSRLRACPVPREAEIAPVSVHPKLSNSVSSPAATHTSVALLTTGVGAAGHRASQSTSAAAGVVGRGAGYGSPSPHLSSSHRTSPPPHSSSSDLSHPHHTSSEPLLPSQHQHLVLAAEVDLLSSIVEERAEHINHVSSEIAEVAELFQDIGILVTGQSEKIAVVERNTAEAKAHTKKAVQELKHAERLHAETTCIIM
jgi:hypothetical protein